MGTIPIELTDEEMRSIGAASQEDAEKILSDALAAMIEIAVEVFSDEIGLTRELTRDRIRERPVLSIVR